MEEKIEYGYWIMWFISCEGNRRWTTIRTPIDWEEYQVRERIPMGGCGDDIAEIISIEEDYNPDSNYGFDFCD